MSKATMLQYVQVAPCIPLKFGGHESYTYHIDQNKEVPEGAVVHTSFGKRNVTGVVLKTGIRKPRYPTKAIRNITTSVLTKHQMQFGQWIAEHAHGGIGYTLRLFVI